MEAVPGNPEDADQHAPEGGNGGADAPPVVAEGTDEVSGEGGTQRQKSPLAMALLHVKWASFLQKAGQHQRAAEHYESSLALFPSARAHFGRGTCLASLRRRQDAVQAFEEALRLKPSMVGAHVNLAGVLVALRRFAEAEAQCRQALELEPGSREAVMNLANALRNLGRREEAIRAVWEHILAKEGTQREKEGARSVPVEGGSQDGPAEELAENVEAASPTATAHVGAPPDPAQLEEVDSLPEVPQADVAPIHCGQWRPLTGPHPLPLVVVCVKWGTRYGADYVNRLHAAVLRQLPEPPSAFVCFTEDPGGLDDRIDVRPLPSELSLWWGKAYLFSEEARLDGNRVLFLDLDQVIVGSLTGVSTYAGPFAVLSTDGIACELAGGGYNSSVMAWEASPFFRPLYARLSKAVLEYVHRFDHWLEMMVQGADLWQDLAPGRVVDFTVAFLGGVCLGSAEEETNGAGAFVEPDGEAEASSPAIASELPPEPPAGTAIVTFPRFPKPHEVLEQHRWARRHWLGDEGA